MNVRLSKRQREQLLVLADVRDAGGRGVAWWWPEGSEIQTADALRSHGYLRMEPDSSGRVYGLTDAGYARVRAAGPGSRDTKETGT